MTDAGTEVESGMAPKPKRRKSRLGRWLMWIGIVVGVLAIVVGIAIAILLHRAEPMMRASLIDTLQKRFHAKVELDDLRVSILDGFWVEGRGLRIWLPPDVQNAVTTGSDADVSWRSQPWIVVGKMKFHASWRILPGKPIVISVIHVEDVRVLLPPKEDRPHMSMPGNNAGAAKPEDTQTAPSSAQQPSQNSSKSKFFKMPPIEVGKIECQAAELVIERKQDSTKPPSFRWTFSCGRSR